LIVIFEPLHDGVGVFTVDGFPFFAVNELSALVVTELDAVEDFLAIHDVRFDEDDGAFVESVCEEVSGPEVGI